MAAGVFVLIAWGFRPAVLAGGADRCAVSILTLGLMFKS